MPEQWQPGCPDCAPVIDALALRIAALYADRLRLIGLLAETDDPPGATPYERRRRQDPAYSVAELGGSA